MWARAWLRIQAVIEERANRLRERFDHRTATRRPVLVVSVLALLTAVLYRVGDWFAFRDCAGQRLSVFDFALTFSAQTLAALLTPLPKPCRDGVLLSLATTDVAFPVAYALLLLALYLWVERYRRFQPGATEAAPSTASSLPLTWLSSLILLLPIAAAILDVFAENLPLLVAAWRLGKPGGQPEGVNAVLVLLGSAGAALKWSLLGVYFIGLLMMFFRGPRGRVLWRLRFSVAAVLVGSLTILLVPQGQDILQRLVEGERPFVRVVFAVLALAFTAVVVWYSARVLTMVRLTRDPARQDEDWMCYFERHIPRMLGVAVPALAGLAFARAALATTQFLALTIVPYLGLIWISNLPSRPLATLGQHVLYPRSIRTNPDLCDRVVRTLLAILLGAFILWPGPGEGGDRQALRLASWLAVVAAWLLYLFVYFRRDLLGGPARGRTAWADPCLGHRVDTLPPAARRAAWVAALASGLLFALFTFDAVWIGWMFGPLVVLALAVANAVYMGSVLAYLGRKTRLPLVSMLMVLAALFSRWNDNHAIRVLPASPPDTLPPTGQLRDRFASWLAVRAREDSGAIPVVLVAAAGGGLRAAYWSGVSLATLQDQDPSFARHLFAISGVSGGSLGGAVFTAAVQDLARPGARPECVTRRETGMPSVSSSIRSSAPQGRTAACIRRFMGDDFLSPVLAKTVAPDFLQWFLPFPVRGFDRAWALEQSWETSYRKAFGYDTFDNPFQALYAGAPPGAAPPLLLLNTTHVQTGRRYVTAPFEDDGAFLDARSVHHALGADLRLSTAVHNSARFTYVSPAGRIDRQDGASYGSLVDGGYFENSGLATLSDVQREIATFVRDTADPALRPAKARTRVLVLYLCNDPLACRRDRVTETSLAAQRGLAGEWLSPLLALLNTRDARGSLARAALARTQGPDFLQLNVCDSLFTGRAAASDSIARARVVNPPLGWQLSRLARDWMDASLTPGPSTGMVGARDTSYTTGSSCRNGNVAAMGTITAALANSRRPRGP